MEVNCKSNYLESSYCAELIKAGVEPYRAAQAAKSMTEKELLLIAEIWANWAKVVTKK
jgi:hypothetical protein